MNATTSRNQLPPFAPEQFAPIRTGNTKRTGKAWKRTDINGKVLPNIADSNELFLESRIDAICRDEMHAQEDRFYAANKRTRRAGKFAPRQVEPAAPAKPERKVYAKVDRQAEGLKLYEAGAVTLHGDSATVNNGRGTTYTITLGDSPTCTCLDWTSKGPGHACKHIIASEHAQTASLADAPANERALEDLDGDELRTVEAAAFADIKAGRDPEAARATIRRIAAINRERRAAAVYEISTPDLDQLLWGE